LASSLEVIVLKGQFIEFDLIRIKFLKFPRCLLGNGERTGNVDPITLALNFYSQGVSPYLDFSNLSEIVAVVCRVNEMAVPPRYPHAGSLVFSAFPGTHQDAIKKGLDAQEKRWLAVDRSGEGIKSWSMPYIPIDPKDLGCSYDNLIRVSSQSGKAGAAYVIKQSLKLELPRRMQVSFYGIVQTMAEQTGNEMTVSLLVETFKKTYIIGAEPLGRLHLESYRLFPSTPDAQSSPMSYSDDMRTIVGFSNDLGHCDSIALRRPAVCGWHSSPHPRQWRHPGSRHHRRPPVESRHPTDRWGVFCPCYRHQNVQLC
jgi:2-isopropylmalate synthase